MWNGPLSSGESMFAEMSLAPLRRRKTVSFVLFELLVVENTGCDGLKEHAVRGCVVELFFGEGRSCFPVIGITGISLLDLILEGWRSSERSKAIEVIMGFFLPGGNLILDLLSVLRIWLSSGLDVNGKLGLEALRKAFP